MTFSNDELILTLISLVRATHPAMLHAENDGFTVDFEAMDRKKVKSHDEKLLLKMRAALEAPAEGAPLLVELSATESKRLTKTLEMLEGLQAWPADVLAMSRDLRKRFTSLVHD